MEKKDKQKIKKPEWNKVTKKIFFGCIIIAILVLVVFDLSFFIAELHSFLWIDILNVINGLMFALLDFSPPLASKFYDIVIIFFIIIIILYLILTKYNKISYKKRNKYYNIIIRITCIASLLIIVNFLLVFINFSIPKFNYKYFPHNVDKKYTENDLIALSNYFKDELIEMSDDFERENGEIVYNDNLVETAVNDLKNISDDYEFLKGFYPKKVGYISERELQKDDGRSLGYTSGYGVMVDKNQNNVHLLNTITHEFCHTKGIMKESEAEFCAFIAGKKSENKFSNYSADYSAFYRLTSVLSYINPKVSNDISEEYLNLCLSKNYTESCNYYPKEINIILSENNYFEIETYRLRNYIMYENEFIDILEKLCHYNNTKLKINDKNIDINKIKDLINKHSKDVVKITIPFDNNSFIDISSYLKEYQKYFQCIYQLNSEYEYGNSLESAELVKYYLDPFNKKALDLLYNDEYDLEYDSDRVVRLLLEYYR